MAHTYEILNHVCRNCCGRLLRRVDADGVEIVRCSDCGSEVRGEARELCWCGTLPPGFKTALRCAMNEHRTPENPSEIIAVEVAL